MRWTILVPGAFVLAGLGISNVKPNATQEKPASAEPKMTAEDAAKKNPVPPTPEGLAEVRNHLWDEAMATLNKSIASSNGSDPSDFLFLAMAYQGRGDKAEAEKNYAHGAEMARVSAKSNPELRMLWAEAAKALGKPAPVLTAAK